MRYGVWCRVSGGMTGTREAWLKSEGVLCVYETFEAAAAEAKKWNDAPRYNSVATFRYTAKEME